ncbi:MAG TPA: neutral/alkaline non-lysosomal ceramidase N-terminal domain-containing protein [Luteitalea sp.]|nr:neutral/alkaline non-lysosomal ceramidase N-terminal domain-containing protein [Luteitalea sp.]
MRAVFLAMAMLLAGVASAQTAPDVPLQAGFAEVDVTPPTGYRMDGYFNERLSTGSKDPLMAKAVVFRQGPVSVALVVADVLGMPQSMSQDVRRRVSAATGIPVANISVAATHTHTGPLFAGERARVFSELAAAKYGKDPLASVRYPEMLRDRLVESIVTAHGRLTPVTLEFVRTSEDRVSFNRRFHMKDGSVRFNPGARNPDIVRVAGPIDPDLPFLMVKRDNVPVGALTVFALHLDTVGGTEYSADYAGHLATELRREFGDGFVSVFGLGTCGDINHLDVSGTRRLQARLIGQQLAVDVVSSLGRTPMSPARLAAASTRVTLPLRPVTAAQVADAKARMSQVGTPAMPFLEQVATVTTLDLATRGATLDADVQVFQLHSDLAVVLLPGEVFSELGLSIKQQSPYAHTLVIELSNDNPAYIPTEKAFREGSYETVNSRIAPGGGERLVTEAVRLLRALKDGAPQGR